MQSTWTNQKWEQWGILFGILLGEFLLLSIKVSKILQLAILFLKKVQYLEEWWGKGWGHKGRCLGQGWVKSGGTAGRCWGMWGHQLGHVGAPVDAGLCLASCQTWHSWEAEQPPGCETQFGCWYIHRYSEAGFSLKTAWINFFLNKGNNGKVTSSWYLVLFIPYSLMEMEKWSKLFVDFCKTVLARI